MSLISAIFGADFGTPDEPRSPDDFCSDGGHHDEDILDKTIMPSAYEQMDEETRRMVFADEYCEESHFRKLLVILLKCKKCGRVKEFTESNP